MYDICVDYYVNFVYVNFKSIFFYVFVNLCQTYDKLRY